MFNIIHTCMHVHQLYGHFVSYVVSRLVSYVVSHLVSYVVSHFVSYVVSRLVSYVVSRLVLHIVPIQQHALHVVKTCMSLFVVMQRVPNYSVTFACMCGFSVIEAMPGCRAVCTH